MERTRVITPLYSTAARPRVKTEVDLPSSQIIHPQTLVKSGYKFLKPVSCTCASSEIQRKPLNVILSFKQSIFTKKNPSNKVDLSSQRQRFRSSILAYDKLYLH